MRASGSAVPDARALIRSLQQLGQPLYQCQPPTGYKDTADAWVNTGALVNRINFAITLAKNTNASEAVALELGSPEFQKR